MRKTEQRIQTEFLDVTIWAQFGFTFAIWYAYLMNWFIGNVETKQTQQTQMFTHVLVGGFLTNLYVFFKNEAKFKDARRVKNLKSS